MLPGFEPVDNDPAWVHRVLGRPAEALRVLEAYVDVNGADARPRDDGPFRRGEAYRALGQREDAVHTLNRYRELRPTGRYAAPTRRSLDALPAHVDENG